jgi:hypothetical protein
LWQLLKKGLIQKAGCCDAWQPLALLRSGCQDRLSGDEIGDIWNIPFNLFFAEIRKANEHKKSAGD